MIFPYWLNPSTLPNVTLFFQTFLSCKPPVRCFLGKRKNYPSKQAISPLFCSPLKHFSFWTEHNAPALKNLVGPWAIASVWNSSNTLLCDAFLFPLNFQSQDCHLCLTGLEESQLQLIVPSSVRPQVILQYLLQIGSPLLLRDFCIKNMFLLNFVSCYNVLKQIWEEYL